ncbi:MAG: dihydropteroate synthase [Acidobacteria bacterium]|nr:dihydropteroate synthase [Acidobacteriota bacterium]
MPSGFLLLEDFRPPKSPAHRRALGLPADYPAPDGSAGLLRVEGLPRAPAGQMADSARRLGGGARRLPSSSPGVCLLVTLPPESWRSFLQPLRHDPILAGLVGELECALRATRGSFAPFRLPKGLLPFSGRTLIQGILNVTPDSFHNGGRWTTPRRAVSHALRMVEEGADLLDVGGESTRPGARPVDAREEIRRVLPVIEALAGKVKVPLSVDTTKAEVAEAALGAGAQIVNDISGLTFEPRLAEVTARHGAGLIVSHIRGRPGTMQKHPRYRHLLPEVVTSLQTSIRRATKGGVRRSAILVDPGIGFGKTAVHNLLLLRYLRALHSTGCPILLGASRKSFLAKLLGDGPRQRLHGSLAVAALAVAGGAAALRVHDVAATLEVVRVAEAVRDATMIRA